jgi:chromosome segregation ATPase
LTQPKAGGLCEIGKPSRTIQDRNWSRHSKPGTSKVERICLQRTWSGGTKSGTRWRDSWVVFFKPVGTAVEELVKERDNKPNQIQDLEDKRSSLETKCQESQHNVMNLKRERELLQIDVQSLRRERDQLQDIGRLQKEENEQLAWQLKNAKMALALEEQIHKNLAIAAEGAKMIMATDKVELIRKDLEHLYQGEAQSFKKLYESMQNFTNDIIQVEEGLERVLKAIREYLQAKHQPAGEGDRDKEKGKVVVEVPLLIQKEVDRQESKRGRWTGQQKQQRP